MAPINPPGQLTIFPGNYKRRGGRNKRIGTGEIDGKGPKDRKEILFRTWRPWHAWREDTRIQNFDSRQSARILQILN
jgi:hypothetical protein